MNVLISGSSTFRNGLTAIRIVPWTHAVKKGKKDTRIIKKTKTKKRVVWKKIYIYIYFFFTA